MPGKRKGPPLRVILAVWSLLLTVLVAAQVGDAHASSAASFTSVDETIDGTGHCTAGNPGVNCNAYDGKQYVWLNGGPIGAHLGAGDYFFAVIAPGGQADPNDGAANLLSTDAVANRTFHIDAAGAITYSGNHDIDGTKIRVAPYADTPNGGGVYVLAICSLADGYPVAGGACKYDAFKVQGNAPASASPLEVTKDATGAYTDTYHWTIAKSADKTLVKQVGGSATFTYTVTVGNDGGVVSGVTVSGTITVVNPNAPLAVTGVNVTDTLSDNTACSVTGGANATVSDFQTDFAYTCWLPALPAASLNNTVTVTWPGQALADQSQLAGGSADFTFTGVQFTANPVDDCVNVTDTYAGNLGNVCTGGTNPTLLTYSRSIPVPASDCASFPNTATFVANTSGATSSASQTVTVCGPHKSGARTIGFWQNKNGQGIITGQAKTGICGSATWLRTFAPFQDLGASATCSQVAAYATNVIKAANASGSSMNAMLKGQMLATALDVYFSDPALGGNKLGAPAPIGSFVVDLTEICSNIGTCSTFITTSSAFGNVASAPVSSLLTYAASQSNAGGSTWYGNVKAKQELAKDTFDAINNEVAFSP